MTRVQALTKRSTKQLQNDLKRGVLALGALGIAATKMAADFDRGLTEIATLMDGVTQDGIRAMGEELKKLSVTAGQSLDALTKARYDIVSAGFRDSADSALLLEQAAKLAAATVSDAGTVGAVLTKTLNAYGLAASEAARVSDILAITIKQGQTTMSELGPTIGQVIPIAAEMGISLEELSAGIATLTAGAGQQTPEAMTSLNAALVSFLKPSEEMQQALERLGYESGRALLEAEGFGGGLESLTRAAEDLGRDIADIFPNIRAMRAAFPLAGKQAGVFADNLDAAKNSAGQMGRMFDTVANSDSFKLTQALNQLKVTMIDLGSVILPEAARVAEVFGATLRENKGAVKALGGAISIVVENIGLLVGGFVAFRAVQYTVAIVGLTTAITGMGIVVGAVVAPLALVVAGLTKLIFFSERGVKIKADPSDIGATKGA
jgi:TP901 family phage tail tape measure protein